MFIPRIIAELPDGWTALDSAEFFGPGGARVRVTGELVEHELDTAGLAARHGQALTDQLTGYREIDVRDVTAFAGLPAIRRDVVFNDNTSDFRGVAIYMVRDGMGYIASATGLADTFDATENDIISVTSALTILGMPLPLNSTQENPDTDGSPPDTPPTSHARPALTSSEWADVRTRWTDTTTPDTPNPTSGTSTPADATNPTDLVLSVDEAMIAAAVMGAGTFPTVAPQTLVVLPAAQRSAIAQTLVRSLMTRGILCADGDQIVPAQSVDALLQRAVYPDLLVEITTTTGNNHSAVAFGVRPESTTVITEEGPFGRRISETPTSELLNQLIAICDTAELGPSTGPEHQAETNDIDRWIWFRSTWRDGTTLVGGQLRWAIINGTLHETDTNTPATGHITLRSANPHNIRTTLLEHLPGNH